MASNKSALKRLRTGKKARIRHKSRRNDLKTFEKKLRSAAESSDLAATGDLLKSLFSKLDKAVKAGTIHRNKANRKKAQFKKILTSAQQKNTSS